MRLLTMREIAERWAVSESTLRRWWRGGLLRSVVLPSGSVRVAESEVTRIEREGERPDAN